jgi:hypothetical protein
MGRGLWHRRPAASSLGAAPIRAAFRLENWLRFPLETLIPLIKLASFRIKYCAGERFRPESEPPTRGHDIGTDTHHAVKFKLPA